MARQIIELPKARRRSEHVCPECGGPLKRVRRTPIQRALVLFSPSKRYRCLDSVCGWKGLIESRQYRRRRRKLFDHAVELLFANLLVGLTVILLLMAVLAVGIYNLMTR